MRHRWRALAGALGLLAALLGPVAAVHAATPPNSVVSNTATATWSVGANNFSGSGTVAVTTAACSSVGLKIDLLQYIPPARAAQAPAGSKVEAVQPTRYAPGGTSAGPFVGLADPVLLGDALPTALPASLLLAPLNDPSGALQGALSQNEPIFVRVVSVDANVTAGQDRVVVILTSFKGGDREVLQLTETGGSTGVFVGVIPSLSAAVGTVPTLHDGKITIAASNEIITGVYNHPSCTGGANIATAGTGLNDPYGIVFDSRTGAALNGARISLIDTLTNLPAIVRCNDGITLLPQPVVSGAPTVCDPIMAAGAFNFPYVAAGSYRLQVTPPAGHVFASAVAPSGLPAMVGTPPTAPVILGLPGPVPGGSYGGVFSVSGPALRVDIPLDAASTSLTIQKTAGKAVVGVGEFLPYTLSITNNSAIVAVVGATIVDHLPPGFRYQKGSARLNGQPIADPLAAGDARSLAFTINIAAGAVVTLRYVLEVTPGARPGRAENSAVASGAFSSNTARASVLVREDLFRSQSMLIGRVIVGACDEPAAGERKGLANARIVLQDGRFVLTDKEGLWHLDNLRPGTHVVQLDLDSLPADYEVLACDPNTRFAGRSFSQFVNLRGGTLWRADFHVQRKVGAGATAIPAVAPVSVAPAADPSRLVEVLPYDSNWLAAATAGNDWLHPQESFHPNLPVVKVAVKHDPAQTLALSVNGVAVSPLLFTGTQLNAARSVALSSWSAVPLGAGGNKLTLVITDAQGREVSRTQRNIHYASMPDRFEFVPQLSRLVADGKTRPLLALRFVDKSGVPVRRGISGEFQINEPYVSSAQRLALEQAPLTGQLAGKPRFEIGADGMALIELEPTTQSGEVVLGFQFNDQRRQELRAWLDAGKRDWILVGFAEGTTGHQTLSGNLEALRAADTERELFDGNRLAFYAKGSIRGDFLLTIAYDSAKKTGDKLLKQAIDPAQYYTLYGDATQAGFDAASASRLYLKLERRQFYAMFGDYDTGLTVTELSRYSRSLTGVKSEYKGEIVGYSAFAATTAQAYVKDEIPGNGTSGLYKLSRGNLVINSDKLRIETRDRFQSHVIVGTRNLTRYLDYDIDYALGTLAFREPINVRDNNFNPSTIVVEYESADPADAATSFGGRASVKPFKGLELGASMIHEGTVGAGGDLQGLDASYDLSANTRLRVEAASSRRERVGDTASGTAWLGEATHRSERWDGRVYMREQALGFGLGQQAGSEMGSRRMGLDGRLKLNDDMQLQGQAYSQETLATGARNSLMEGRINQRIGDSLNIHYGARSVQDSTAAGEAQSNQLVGGAAYTMPNRKLTLRAGGEIGSGTAGSVYAPDRVILGADYAFSAQTSAFAEEEFARGEKFAINSTRVGLRTQPWTGGEVAASVGNSSFNDAGRLYGNLGLVQRWQISKQWQADLSFDRSQTLRNTAVPLNIDSPLPFGAIAGDYTAASAGAVYVDSLWSGNGRIEIRRAEAARQTNLQFGLQRKLGAGRAVAAGFTLRQADDANGSTRYSDLRASYAYRPHDSRWVVFDRADWITQSGTAVGGDLKGSKLVNNMNANYMLDRRTQISLQYGAKYVVDSIDGIDYKGYTDLIGIELRRDLTRDWDIGVFGSVMRSANSGVRDYSVGASVGYKLMENTWVSVGYNLRGLDDRDFTGAGYRAGGFFVSLRMKFDQDTFDLNKLSKAIDAMVPGAGRAR
jgi:uncharacterized repeat protein (TIGR01451 family)